MENFFFKSVIWTVIFISVVAGAENCSNEIRDLSKKVEELKTLHNAEVSTLKKEVAQLKKQLGKTNPQVKKNDHAIKALETNLRILTRRVNNSNVQDELNSMDRDVTDALVKSSVATEHTHNLLLRADEMKEKISGLTIDYQNLRTMLNDVREQYLTLAKEVKDVQLTNFKSAQRADNDVQNDSRETHKIRHSKSLTHQLARVIKFQNQIQHTHLALRYQVMDTIKRVEKLETYDYEGLSNIVNFADLRAETIQDYFKNISRRVSDMDKIHRSLLELREEVEGMENTADKTVPEFRKEISKLDGNLAQVNAHVSYLREGQENLRQSVKAIAVSVSNTMDRAEADRQVIKHMNESIGDLQNKSKQHFHRLNDHILKAETNYATNPTEEIPLPILMDEVKELEPVDVEYKQLVNKLPHDCSTISGPPGTYLIHPGHAPVSTWCVNGSTLLQRRYNGSIEFNRKFNEYVNGFGNPASEYWLGLESMHLLTSDNCSSMRIDMVDIYGGAWYAEYDTFYIGSSDTGYVLDVGGFKGNASDAFEYQNHMEFSAIDHDRDISNTHCAGNYEGGWWFSHCQHVNINGKYNLGLTWFDSGKNEWIAVATSEMRMYRKC